MSVIHDGKQEIIRMIGRAIGKAYRPTVDDLDTTPDQKMGDIAFPCFNLAKGLKKNPADISRELAAKIGPSDLIKKIEAHGSYLNFFFDTKCFGKAVMNEIQEKGASYGHSDFGKGKRILLEYAQPNTHKQIHVGHLRNFFIGQSMVEVLKTSGYEVIPVVYINDLGAHVARCLWAMKKFHNEESISADNRMHVLGKAYTEASNKIESSQKTKKEISKIYFDLERGEGDYLSLWKKTRKWSVDSFKQIFKELNLPIDAWYFESDLVSRTHKIIKSLIKDGIVVKSEGAYIVDLEEEKLGVNLLVKSDGTLLYNAKDIALALKKDQDHQPDKSLYVIDVRQSLAMKQLFITLDKMDFKKELNHISYEFLTLKDGSMSSRKGNVIRYEDFRDALLDLAKKETELRHEDWKEKKIKQTANNIAFSAMRFGILRQDPDKQIVFDMDEAMSFDGFTGPYLLYTYARIQSILKKAGSTKLDYEAKELNLPSEHKLLFHLSRYPEILLETVQDFNIGRIAQYSFELAKIFSEFYSQAHVLNAENEVCKSSRLALCESVAQTLENSLILMGIETIDEM
jgi:arginyl-tRNA synthetase